MENKDKIQDEFIDFWEKTDNVGLGNYSDAVTQWWFEKIESILESKQEEIEKAMNKNMLSETEMKGGVDYMCGKAYNQAILDLKPIISNLLK